MPYWRFGGEVQVNRAVGVRHDTAARAVQDRECLIGLQLRPGLRVVYRNRPKILDRNVRREAQAIGT